MNPFTIGRYNFFAFFLFEVWPDYWRVDPIYGDGDGNRQSYRYFTLGSISEVGRTRYRGVRDFDAGGTRSNRLNQAGGCNSGNLFVVALENAGIGDVLAYPAAGREVFRIFGTDNKLLGLIYHKTCHVVSPVVVGRYGNNVGIR